MSAAAVEPRPRVLIAAERRPTRARLRLALERDARCMRRKTPMRRSRRLFATVPMSVCSASRRARIACGPRRRSLARAPSVAVIVLTNRPDEDEFMAAMRGGAAGYLPQSLDPERLPDVVRSTLRGEPAVPRRFVARLLAELQKPNAGTPHVRPRRQGTRPAHHPRIGGRRTPPPRRHDGRNRRRARDSSGDRAPAHQLHRTETRRHKPRWPRTSPSLAPRVQMALNASRQKASGD